MDGSLCCSASRATETVVAGGESVECLEDERERGDMVVRRRDSERTLAFRNGL